MTNVEDVLEDENIVNIWKMRNWTDEYDFYEPI